MNNNILLEEFYTPPFSRINTADYIPAIETAIAHALAEVDAIVSNPDKPTFENTIEALEQSGRELDRILGVFYPLLSAEANEEMMDASLRISSLTSDFSTKISLNRPLFERIKTVFDSKPQLTTEHQALLEKTYLGFTRSGANLQEEDRKRFAEISTRLSELTTIFSQNVKKELATYRFPLEASQTEGLPQWLLDQAQQTARAEGADTPYLLTLDQPVYMTFMRLSPFDNLRRQLYMLYNSRNRSGQYSNIEVLKEIATLRLEMARLLGYNTFADFKLERTMAQTPAGVMGLLEQLRKAYATPLEHELAQLREFAGEEITPWNYAFHFNRLRKQLHDFDEEEMRPYFELSAVVGGVFSLAEQLYGIRLTERTDVETYHSDVRTFEATDSDGSVLGLLYTDFFPRSGRKSPGAWMTEFREADGTTRPLVNIVMNFTKPGADVPSMLTPGEVSTLLHEFGHALHALLTRANYTSLAGTNVFRDFVELPSQFNENFLTEPKFLRSFARHYETGAPIPDEMIERLKAASNFGAAYACMRQLNFGYLDMAWHSISTHVSDAVAFENEAINPVRIFPAVEGTLISPTFSHIFAGGYAAGYYSYKWAEVLDADAFSLFRERGIFDQETAMSFRREILEKGGTEHPALLFRRFRGRDPEITPLLARDGIVNHAI
ncbi:MAG: M3 family metallopeptidase [Muribaculaceae bacterium]|nr:M3 family metallopeptidase [Muribaculaceae bacterium]